MSDQRHHIADPTIRALVQEQVIAELRRIADAMERGVMGMQPVALATPAPSKPVNPDDIHCINPKQAAFDCGVSVDTIERLWRTGKAGKKVGGLLFFSKRELESYKARKR